MGRAFLVVLDSVGIGGAPDADAFFNGATPDTGANTLVHIAEAVPLRLPNLTKLGLGSAAELASGQAPRGLDGYVTGTWGTATPASPGKDTPTGHWELAGVPVPWTWHTFPETVPAFPQDLVDAVSELAGSDGILGNCHASGTVIIAEHGATHMQTGQPICYTSADSVFQIAAHEETFGLDRLLALCAALAPRLHAMKVGRVIARPFVGTPRALERTGNRRDYAIAPPAPVLTEWVQTAGRRVYAVGKIGDIFSMKGIDEVRKGSDAVLAQHLSDLVDEAADGSLTFANFVEFDSLFGHRRDPAGYAAHLEWFDGVLGELLPRMRNDDMLLITADHGNDPTWVGTDHTRERVPVLIAGQGPGTLGKIPFTGVADIIASHLSVARPE